MNIISIHIGHGSSITFYQDGEYHILEGERLFKSRYFGMYKMDEVAIHRHIKAMLEAGNEYWGIRNDFDICTYTGYNPNGVDVVAVENGLKIIKQLVKAKEFVIVDHHLSHAYNSFYLSDYDKAFVVSYDGSGNDGVFNIYFGKKQNGLELIESLNVPSMGKYYRRPVYVLNEIEKVKNGIRTHRLAMPGKLMGLSAYGKVRKEWVEPFIKYYNTDDITKSISNLSSDTGIEFITDKFFGKHILLNDNDFIFKTYGGEIGHDIARTNQYVFEEVFIDRVMPYLSNIDYPVCISGGCGYNVLANERLRMEIGDRIFVSPNCDDSGLTLGQSFYIQKPVKEELKNIAYSGLPILDNNKLLEYAISHNAIKADITDLTKLLKEGEIIGIIQGGSEVGARALGNRSIICDASFPEMKDKINKIKNREPYRPFAPMVRLEEANKYFDFSHESPYMSFAPMVRKEFKSLLPAITHVDGTARLQTVTRQQNEFIYDLLTDFGGVLLNTSFNIKGKPILTTLEDALHVLNTTNLDYVYTQGLLFKK